MNEEVRNETVRRWREGQSFRGIARDLQLARKTVKRLIETHQRQREEGVIPSELTPRKKRPSQLDEYEDALRELLDRYPTITATRLLQELRAQGYGGGYTILRQRVNQLRPRKSSPFVERFETALGQQAQMDYAVYDLDFTHEGRRRVNLFAYILGYSRRQYLRFVESQDMETTLREHVRAFEYLGGVAATCLYDNMKVVVARYEDGEPIYNTRFLAFATHYGFQPFACRPRRPQTKGKIERQFDYVEKNLLNGRTFRSLEHLNEVTAWWLAEVADVRVHRGTGKPEHRPPRDIESRRQLARQQFQELGASAVAFLEGLLRTQRRGWQQARKVLAFQRNYRREDLLAALERATRFGAFSLGAVERILAVQARPKTSYEHLADQTKDHLRELLGDDPTPPRSTAEYQQFLFEEPDQPEKPDDEQTPEDDQPGE